ncbi:MAG: putative capsid protein [Cressdnaviricota sp.]|nr:MAG: putative capsid protein [Cressdnaviricota sp.]
MVRKYSGPLQPGRKSAYVKGTRKKSTYKRSSNLPSRARFSSSRLAISKQISKALRNVTENKFQGSTLIDQDPIASPNGNPISYHFFNSGSIIPGPNYSEFTAQKLFTFPQGIENDERQGNYMFIKKSHISMEVQALPDNQKQIGNDNFAQPILEFRLMVVKANRKYNELGTSPDPGSSLFLNTENNKLGYDTTGQPTFYYVNQPINKRKWLVYKDVRFKLSPPVLNQDMAIPAPQVRVNAAYDKYPTKKLFRWNLPVFKKTHFTNNNTPALPSDNTPDNLDTQWLTILQCVKGSYGLEGSTRPTNYSVNILGSTIAQDS